MMRVLANDGMDKNAAADLLKNGIFVDSNHYEKEELYNIIVDFDILIVRSATKVDKAFIDAAKNKRLKLVIRAGVGMDNIDIDYAQKNGIEVRNTPNSSSNSVAELVLGHMIGLARYITIANITLREGKWNKKAYTGTELSGKTFGIIGFGRIGKALATKATALGMKVVFYDKFYKSDDKFEYIEFEELLKKADFISLHVPGMEKALIGEAEFKLMKDGVFLINAARGGVIDEEALVDALNTDKVAGAGIDVFMCEPKPNKELCNHPKVSVTPHIGAATAEAQMRIGEETIDIIMEYYNALNAIAI
jgi:D-3-phosphoglycerate dehydrogenase